MRVPRACRIIFAQDSLSFANRWGGCVISIHCSFLGRKSFCATKLDASNKRNIANVSLLSVMTSVLLVACVEGTDYFRN